VSNSGWAATVLRDGYSALLIKGLMLVVLLGSAKSCGGDIALPEPARPPGVRRRESDDWIKPGKMVQLKGVGLRFGPKEMRLVNAETFGLTLLDDIWLTLYAPNVEPRQGGPDIGDGRDGWYVHLRCPTSRSIPAGAEIPIPYDKCFITTYEPGPGNRLIGFRIVAREGYSETHIEGGGEIVRSG
jgi:hypothetical protein